MSNMNLVFSGKSEEKLYQCGYGIQAVMRKALAMGIMDFSIIEGHRGEVKQTEYFTSDPPRSKVPWPKGNHNSRPSKAVDAVPYIDGSLSWNKLHCCVLAGVVLACAKTLSVKIRWGGNWDMDLEPIADQDFQDLVHFEEVD